MNPAGFTSNRARRPELSIAVGSVKFTSCKPFDDFATRMGLSGQLMKCGGSWSVRKKQVLDKLHI